MSRLPEECFKDWQYCRKYNITKLVFLSHVVVSLVPQSFCCTAVTVGTQVNKANNQPFATAALQHPSGVQATRPTCELRKSWITYSRAKQLTMTVLETNSGSNVTWHLTLNRHLIWWQICALDAFSAVPTNSPHQLCCSSGKQCVLWLLHVMFNFSCPLS